MQPEIYESIKSRAARDYAASQQIYESIRGKREGLCSLLADFLSL